MNELGISLLWCVLQVSVVGLLSLAVCVLARRFAPGAGSSAALSGLLIIVGLSALSLSPWPCWWELAPRADKQAVANEPSLPTQKSAPALDEPNSDDTSHKPAGAAMPSSMADDFWKSLASELSRPAPSAAPAGYRWPAGLAILFACGAVFGLVHLVVGLAAVRSYRRRSRPLSSAELLEQVDVLRAELSCTRSVELRQCDDLVTAATVGWRRPMILLPPEWTTWREDERRTVLAHELAHISRHDFAACVLAQLSVALHFYHPLVHWLAARLRLEQELAADAAAAALVGGPKVYLRTLADLALRQSDRRMSWPARSFLPTRGTFLRRIEMLRDARKLPAKSSLAYRLANVALVVLVGLAAAGLRMPGGSWPAALAAPPGAGEEVAAAADTKPDTSSIDTTFVADDAVAVAALRPAGLLRRADMQDLRKQLETLLPPAYPSLAQIEQITLVMHGVGGARREAQIVPACGFILRGTKADDFAKFVELSVPDAVERRLGPKANQVYYRSGHPGNAVCYYRPNDRTLVLDLEEHIVKAIVSKPKPASLVSSEAWKKAAAGQMAVAVDCGWLRTMQALLNDRATQVVLSAPVDAFSPLWHEADTLIFSARLDDKLTLQASAVCGTTEGAKKVQETAEAARTLARNIARPLRRQLADIPAGERPIVAALLDLGEKMLDDVKFEREGSLVQATTAAEVDALKVSLLAMTVIKMREAAMRSQSMNNLKQIGLAFHNYHDVNRHFPAGAILGPDGKTTHSWRVAILPYIEQQALYQAYKFDEPWDSENNKKILAKMPSVFRHPSAPQDSTSAAYYGFSGPTAVFSDKPALKGSRLEDITDGTSNTLLVVEANRDIPWTKPEDLPYSPDKPLPKLGGWTEGGYNTLMCDGSVHFLGGGIDERKLRAWITRGDGEPVNFEPDKIPFGDRPLPVPAAETPRLAPPTDRPKPRINDVDEPSLPRIPKKP